MVTFVQSTKTNPKNTLLVLDKQATTFFSINVEVTVSTTKSQQFAICSDEYEVIFECKICENKELLKRVVEVAIFNRFCRVVLLNISPGENCMQSISVCVAWYEKRWSPFIESRTLNIPVEVPTTTISFLGSAAIAVAASCEAKHITCRSSQNLKVPSVELNTCIVKDMW